MSFDRFVNYNNYPRDGDGWIDIRYRPTHDFRMCKLLTSNGIKLNGWWTGYIWDGLHVTPDTKIIKWKIEKEVRYE